MYVIVRPHVMRQWLRDVVHILSCVPRERLEDSKRYWHIRAKTFLSVSDFMPYLSLLNTPMLDSLPAVVVIDVMTQESQDENYALTFRMGLLI